MVTKCLSSTNSRRGLAMVELIFSITVMGIVMLSVPALLQTTQSSVGVVLQQEGINEGASEVMKIMTYWWDENDVNKIPAPVLHTVNGDSHLKEVGDTKRRVGVPMSSSSRTFLYKSKEYNATVTSKLGLDTNELQDGKDDIDDFNGTQTSVNSVNQGSGGIDYVETDTVQINDRVIYLEDNASYNSSTITYSPSLAPSGTKSTSIKQISVVVTSSSGVSELNKTLRFKAFSSNIGGFNYERRFF